MKIAIPVEDDYICRHFGRSPYFTVVEISNNKEMKRELVKSPRHEYGVIPEFLNKLGVDCLICSGIGNKAQKIFKDYNIETVIGAEGKVNDIIKDFISGKIESRDNICDH
jgi:predicted Fe-Mo cluster-binding NifX family protein